MFLFRKKNRVRVKVSYLENTDTYVGMATDGTCSVFECYGGTREAAEEMARLRLRLAHEEGPRQVTHDFTQR